VGTRDRNQKNDERYPPPPLDEPESVMIGEDEEEQRGEPKPHPPLDEPESVMIGEDEEEDLRGSRNEDEMKPKPNLTW